MFMAVPSQSANPSPSVPRREPSPAVPQSNKPARAQVETVPSLEPEKAGASDRDRQLISAIDQLDLQPSQRAYLQERWLGQLRYLGQNARRAQIRYYSLRLIAILGGVTVPALIGLNVGGTGATVVQWLAFVLGLLVAAAVALEEFFRFGERWRHFRQQAELLRSEGWAFLEGSGSVYRRYETHAVAFHTFVARAEEAMRQEIGVYIAEVVRPPEDQKAGAAVRETSDVAHGQGSAGTPPRSHR